MDDNPRGAQQGGEGRRRSSCTRSGASSLKWAQPILAFGLAFLLGNLSWAAADANDQSEEQRMKAEVKMAFSHTGAVVLGVGYAHLLVPVSLQPLKDHVNHLKAVHMDILSRRDGLNNNRYNRDNMINAMKKVIEMEMRRVEHEYESLRSLLNLDPDLKLHSFAHRIVQDSEGRTKRFLGALLVGGILGGILGLGAGSVFSMFGDDDLDELRGVVKDQSKRIDVVYGLVNISHTGMIANRASIETLKLVTTDLIKVTRANEAASLSAQAAGLANYLYSHALSMIDIYYEGLTAAKNSHRLLPHLVDIQELNKTYGQLLQDLKDKGFQPFFGSVTALFHLPATYQPLDGGFLVVVHVPVATKENVLMLYRVDPMPVQVGAVIVFIQPRESHLAISTDRTLYRPLMAEELADCENYRTTWLCDKAQVMMKDSQDHCLMALFTNRYVDALKLCPVVVHQPVDHAIRTGLNQFQTYTAEAGMATLRCLNGTVRHLPVHKFQKFKLEQTCSLEMPHLKLLNTPAFPKSPVVETYQWSIDFDQLLQNISIPTLNMLVDKLKAVGVPPTDLNTYKMQAEHYEVVKAMEHRDLEVAEESGYLSHGIKEIILYTVGGVVLVCAIWLLVHCYCKYRGHKEFAKDHKYDRRMQSMLEQEKTKQAGLDED